MEKPEIVRTLHEMANVLEITDANEFEISAYRNAAHSVDEWDGDISKAALNSTLTKIPAVGKGVAKFISDLVSNGSTPEHQQVLAQVPKELPTLLRIRGLGPKRVRTIWKELDVEGPADLQSAAEDGRLEAVRGFGAKTVEKILSGLDYLQNSTSSKKTTSIELSEVSMPIAPKGTGTILAGTSGFSYPKWKGTFFPEDAKTDDLLQHYANRLATVEINNTFYRFPSVKVVDQWIEQTPAHFRFSIKAHQRITHKLRLSEEARQTIVDLVDRCGRLEARLGCILFQFPPNFSRDDTRLQNLLKTLPVGPRYAVEFRHASWHDNEISTKLADRNIAMVAGDSEKDPASKIVTADFVYARLRKPAYTKKEFDKWNDWFTEQRAENRDVLVYLKHDDTGDAPLSIVARWTNEISGRKLLRDQLASPEPKTASRRRKSG